ncbi:PIN domain containing protein [Halalkaliarchaeum sp. AArc-CO]|uniref:PIN domain-containing protein n=1 Tax=Halalkaliarchaeum sp. AArc-CO TaxID=2866381 RepID=UPI00217E5F03|nr:PIN domain-containing protein [Halalkaliarchaeum sp. AArc-CO]UWG51839.1 PIN domain containing protein [Halalkaliarchaeum sp. AArc-CO]
MYEFLDDTAAQVALAAEAALVDAELHDSGTPIGALDTLIAGVAREAGAILVAADDHFERVNGPDVHRYR